MHLKTTQYTMNDLLKALVNLIYSTKRVRQKYQTENPTETVLAADGAKGIVTNNDQILERGLDWVTSQRSVILLTTKNIVCGNWSIPLDNINNVQLLEISSIFGSGQVLKIQTKDNKNYQFGMQMNKEWTNQSVLPLSLEKAKIANSLFSIMLRIFLIGYIAFLIYHQITK